MSKEIILPAEIWVETYCHIAEEIGARYHGDGYFDLNEDERLELIDFAEGILHSAGFTKGDIWFLNISNLPEMVDSIMFNNRRK